jgi:HK97 family phage portal protein
VDGKIVRLAREDVIHFRNGIDPYNQRLGMSPLRSVLREVYTDIEAANYSAALVRNMGAVPALISPDPAVFKEAGAVLSRERAEEMKEQWVRRSTGDERGKPLVQSVPVKIQGGQDFVFSPEQMAVRELRKIPEERICAVLGIPPGVVGLGAGLDRNTFSNMREGREQAYESNVIPTHWLVSQEMDRSLLVDYTDDPTYSTGFDISKVRVLAEDEDQISKRVVNEYKEGVITRGEGRSKLGYEDRGAEDEVYYPGTDPDTVAEEQEEQAAAAAERLEGMREQQRDGVGANGNGNGNGPAMRSIDGTLVPPGHYYIVGESGGAQPFDPRRSSLKVQELLAEAGAAGRAADAAGAAGHGAGHTGEDGAAHRENGRDGAGGPGAHGA